MYNSQLKVALSLSCKMNFKLEVFLIRKVFIKSISITRLECCFGGEWGFWLACFKVKTESQSKSKAQLPTCVHTDFRISSEQSTREGQGSCLGHSSSQCRYLVSRRKTSDRNFGALHKGRGPSTKT